MTKIALKSEKRETFGRKVSRLRKVGRIPANVFGNKIESHAISVDSKEFADVFKRAGETQIIDLEGKSVLVSNLQRDPISDEIIHIDFRQVSLTEKIEAKIPVELEGESIAEKQNLGTIVQQLSEVEVEALPSDLPEKIIVDISVLTDVDQAIYVKDLKVGNKVEIMTDKEMIVVKVEAPTVEEVVEVPVSAEATAGVPVEGEKPAEENKEEAKV